MNCHANKSIECTVQQCAYPDYHHDGKYTGVDMDFVSEQLALHPDKDVWLIGHYFNVDAESDAFCQLLG